METLTSKSYFQEVSQNWDDMGGSFFGEAPRETIYSHLNLSPNAKVADIGSGTGYLLEPLQDQPLNIYAMDQSAEMLDMLSEKFNHSSNLTTLVCTSEHLKAESDTMDVVMANMYLHHVENPPAAIKEMVRILKPGGTLIFTDLDSHDYDFLITEQHDRWKGFERSDIEQWMSDAGLKDVSLDCVGANCCADSGGCDATRAEINIFVAKGRK